MLWWDVWLFSVRCISRNLHSFFAEDNKAGPSYGEANIVFIVTTRFTSCHQSLTVLHLRLWPDVIESQSINLYKQLKWLHIWPMNNEQAATNNIEASDWGKSCNEFNGQRKDLLPCSRDGYNMQKQGTEEEQFRCTSWALVCWQHDRWFVISWQ